MGGDCAVSKNAVPTILDMSIPNCDVRSIDCSSVEIKSMNAAGVPTLMCRVYVLTVSCVTQQTSEQYDYNLVGLQ
jgi:hypothetical protein